MLSVLWRQWLDSESVLYQGSTFWCSLDSHKLPVLTRNKEDKRHRCLRPVLLQQIICFLAVVDRSQGQIHGSEGEFSINCLPLSVVPSGTALQAAAADRGPDPQKGRGSCYTR